MKKYKPSRNFLLSTGLLFLAFFTMQGIIVPSIVNKNSGAQTISSRQTNINIYNIKPSEKFPGVFNFNYKFNTVQKLKDSALFDVSIEPFDETKIGGAENFGQIRDAWGYPVRENAYMKQGAKGKASSRKASMNPFKALEAFAYDPDPNTIGIYNCRATTSVTGYFKAYFEDVALDTDAGYDDQAQGDARRQEACQVLEDISELIMLDQTDVTPDILFMADPDMPVGALAAASSYFGYYSVGPDNGSLHKHIISQVDPRPDTGEFDAFIMTGFDGISWDVDSSLNSNTYDFYTVMYHEVMHTLGFRGLLPAVIASTNDTHQHDTFDLFSYKNNTLANPFINALNGLLQTPTGAPSPWFITNDVVYRGVKNIIGATPDGSRPVYSPLVWQQGSSLSHFDMNRAPGQTYVMHPAIGTNTERDIHNHEKEILCHLGYQVLGMSGCGAVTPFANSDWVFLDGTTPTCVNPLANDIAPGSSTAYIHSLSVISSGPNDLINYYTQNDCGGSAQTVSVNARSFELFPDSTQAPRIFTYTVRNDVGRISFPATITATVDCGSLEDSQYEYVCNGDFDVAVPQGQWLFSQIRCTAWGTLAPDGDFVLNACQFQHTPDVIHADSTTFYTASSSPAPLGTDFPYLRNAGGIEATTMKLREPLVPGQEYIISFDYARDETINTSNVKFALVAGTPVNNAVGAQINVPSPNQLIFDDFIDLDPWVWDNFEQNFTANDAYESLVFFSVASYDSGGDVPWLLFDNISIRPANTVSTLQNTVSGRVYQDLNQNGSYETQTESGLSGVQIGLFEAGGSTPIQTAITQDIPNLGKYEFNNLPAGMYYAALINESIYASITQPNVSTDPFPSMDHVYGVSVTSGQNISDLDFGVGLVTGGTTDIQIKKTLIDSTLSIFDRYITWRIIIQNLGQNDATNVLVKEVVPPGLIYHSNTTPSPNVYDSSIHILSIPELLAGGQTYIDITMKVPNSNKVCGKKINTAVLHHLDQIDTNSDNNQDQASIKLQNCPITEAPQVKTR